MIFKTSSLQSCEVRATDGVVGRVADLLFDDQTWAVRYVVVDTGTWLTGRRVLVAPGAVRARDEHCVTTDLSRAQVQSSPAADVTHPTRGDEERLHEHYRWTPYWMAGTAGGMALQGSVMPAPPTLDPPRVESGLGGRTESAVATEHHLRSARDLRGRQLAAADGEIGSVEDLLLDAASWQVRYLVLDTTRWWPGGLVVIAPEWLSGVDWDTGQVTTDLTRDEIKGSPAYDPKTPPADDYFDRLHAHYRREPHRGAS